MSPSKRCFVLPIAALTAMATLPVLAGAAPAGASPALSRPSPLARGGSGDDGSGDPKGPKKQEKPENCPTKLYTVPVELKGLACILLLPKPDEAGGDGESGGGVGGLLGG